MTVPHMFIVLCCANILSLAFRLSRIFKLASGMPFSESGLWLKPSYVYNRVVSRMCRYWHLELFLVTGIGN